MSIAAISGAAAQANEPTPVFTRARFTSAYEEPGGKLYVRTCDELICYKVSAN